MCTKDNSIKQNEQKITILHFPRLLDSIMIIPKYLIVCEKHVTLTGFERQRAESAVRRA